MKYWIEKGIEKVFIDKLNRDLIGRITQLVTCTLHWKTWHKLINKTKYALIIIKNDDSWNMLQKDPTWLHELCDFFFCVCVCETVWRKRNHNGNGQSKTTPHGAIKKVHGQYSLVRATMVSRLTTVKIQTQHSQVYNTPTPFRSRTKEIPLLRTRTVPKRHTKSVGSVNRHLKMTRNGFGRWRDAREYGTVASGPGECYRVKDILKLESSC